MTETDVCNMALGMLGHDRVIKGDVRTADSTEALRCRLHLDGVRRRVLGDPGGWRFNWRSVRMRGRRGDADGWYSWMMPEDALWIKGVWSSASGEAVGWNKVGRVVECGCEVVDVEYVADVVEPDEWPQMIVDAVAAELAARVAGGLLGRRARMMELREQAQVALDEARRWDATQRGQRVVRIDRYSRARRG